MFLVQPLIRGLFLSALTVSSFAVHAQSSTNRDAALSALLLPDFQTLQERTTRTTRDAAKAGNHSLSASSSIARF